MSSGYQIVVCAGIVPDPLQTLEPISGPAGPALKNEAMLPAILDPWAAHALFEAAHLAAEVPDSKVWLVSLGPKAKLQQVMMTVAQPRPRRHPRRRELLVVNFPVPGLKLLAERQRSKRAELLDHLVDDAAHLVALGGGDPLEADPLIVDAHVAQHPFSSWKRRRSFRLPSE